MLLYIPLTHDIPDLATTDLTTLNKVGILLYAMADVKINCKLPEDACKLRPALMSARIMTLFIHLLSETLIQACTNSFIVHCYCFLRGLLSLSYIQMILYAVSIVTNSKRNPIQIFSWLKKKKKKSLYCLCTAPKTKFIFLPRT